MTHKQLRLLYVICMAAAVVVFCLKPIRQDPFYHRFADGASLFSIPNFWNVASNLPFVFIGIIGLIQARSVGNPVLRPNYYWFFIGIFLTGFGSGYYHWNPNDETLVWDRLPMTISFMSFLSIIAGEFIHANSAKKLLYPLLLAGLASIAVWIFTDDLRMYVLIQFLPILLILIILLLSKKEPQYKKYFWLIVLAYAVAKFLEWADDFVFRVSDEMISGHSLKHLAAALAPFLFYKFVQKKSKLNAGHHPTHI